MNGSAFYFLVAAAAAAATTAETTALRDIRHFSVSEGNRVWRGYGEAPFDFLLIEGDGERLFCRSPLPDGFKPEQPDPVTGCQTGWRSRSGLPDSLLAAMPAFGPPSTIVMGTLKTTGLPEGDWTRTILHEHFHQWVNALPGYYDRVEALDLKGGDNTGMWMLNFPFPYSDPLTAAAFKSASSLLAAALDARDSRNFKPALLKYLEARQHLARTVGARNWRYAEFQLWNEGVARWTEIQLGKRFPDPTVRRSAVELEKKTRAWLDKPDIGSAGREFVYPYGAAEAMLLEACGSDWREQYPRQLALGPLLEQARRNCRA